MAFVSLKGYLGDTCYRLWLSVSMRPDVPATPFTSNLSKRAYYKTLQEPLLLDRLVL